MAYRVQIEPRPWLFRFVNVIEPLFLVKLIYEIKEGLTGCTNHFRFCRNFKHLWGFLIVFSDSFQRRLFKILPDNDTALLKFTFEKGFVGGNRFSVTRVSRMKPTHRSHRGGTRKFKPIPSVIERTTFSRTFMLSSAKKDLFCIQLLFTYYKIKNRFQFMAEPSVRASIYRFFMPQSLVPVLEEEFLF